MANIELSCPATRNINSASDQPSFCKNGMSLSALGAKFRCLSWLHPPSNQNEAISARVPSASAATERKRKCENGFTSAHTVKDTEERVGVAAISQRQSGSFAVNEPLTRVRISMDGQAEETGCESVSWYSDDWGNDEYGRETKI